MIQAVSSFIVEQCVQEQTPLDGEMEEDAKTVEVEE